MAKRAKSQGPGLFTGELPKMPEGYYSGDKPNPHIRRFVEEHGSKDVPDILNPHVESIMTSKRNPIYGLHGYDSKKPPDALQAYVEAFTRPGELVLDPFVGSGMTAIASLSSGRRCIAIDLSPLAAFITANYCAPVDSRSLLGTMREILPRAEKAAGMPYATTCGHCGKQAAIYSTIYSQTYQCRRCLSKVPLFDAIAGAEGDNGEQFKASCPACAKRDIVEPISTRQERLGYMPVAIEYSCTFCGVDRLMRTHLSENRREAKLFSEVDLLNIEKLEGTRPRPCVPTRPMMWNEAKTGSWGLLWRPYHGEMRRVDQFFTHRNLLALGSLFEEIRAVQDERIRTALMFMFSAFVVSQSKLQRYHPGSTFPNMVAPGLLYVAPLIREYNVFQWYQGKVEGAAKGFDSLAHLDPGALVVSTQSATDLSSIPSNSIDYILTDPPYSGRIQYGELNFIQEAWLGFSSNWLDGEIIVNAARGKTEAGWAMMMRQAMAECFRVLKPERWLSLCYHDSAEGTWELIQDLMAEVGFVAEDAKAATYIDAKEKSLKQITADKITKRDLVINFRKPKLGEGERPGVVIPADVDRLTFRDLAQQIIRDHLRAYPGATKDRIYDELVSRMVRSGQMRAHNFEEILSAVAEKVSQVGAKDEASRWYLKDRELEMVDAAESSKEDAAAERIGAFIKKALDKSPDQEGVHYSDIFEQYVYSIQDKPRRPLAEWLLDYFYRTDEGTYRLPASVEELKLKADGRKAGTNRKVKRYVALLEQGLAIPEKIRPNDATLAEWIRACKRSGLYEQGKLLYEKGGVNLDKLPEELMVNVEEDYQVCVRMLARSGTGGDEKKPKRGRRKKSEADHE